MLQGDEQGLSGGPVRVTHRQTNLGVSALMATSAEGATGAPALVSTRPLTVTLPCVIQDCTVARLCCGCCARHTSSSRRFLLALAAACLGAT